MQPSFFKNLGPFDNNKINSVVDCQSINVDDTDKFIDLVSIDKIKKNSLSFLYDDEIMPRNLPKDSCIICTKKKINELNSRQKVLLVKDVQKAVAKLSNLFYRDLNDREIRKLKPPIMGENCKIGNNVVIENGVIIGDNVKIEHGAIIKHSCLIGNGSKIGSNVVISNSILGESTYIGSNSSIGQRGFGFYIEQERNINIYHIGRVVIHSSSSIGSSCTIDRGSFSDTTIGENTYIDNLCHIAHNVEIGNNCAFAAMTGIAGSAKLGNYVLAGGQTGIAGHIRIGNNVKVAAKSGVFKNINDGESVMGNPAIKTYQYLKNYKKIYGN